MRTAVDAVEQAEGAIGVLVNNAGYSQSGAVETVPMDDVRRQFETNVFGLLRMCQLALPGMRAPGLGQDRQHQLDRRPARLPGRRRLPRRPSTRSRRFSDALRFEVRGFGVDVILIEPGLITTKFGETAAGSVGDALRRGPYAQFNDAVGRGHRGRLRGRAGEARRRPGDRREEDREGDHRAAAEDALPGHPLGAHDPRHRRGAHRPRLGPLRRHPVPAPGGEAARASRRPDSPNTHVSIYVVVNCIFGARASTVAFRERGVFAKRDSSGRQGAGGGGSGPAPAQPSVLPPTR